MLAPQHAEETIIRALKECDWLISSSPHKVLVYTDHKGIVDSMANRNQVHGKVAQWADILFEYLTCCIYRRNTTKVMGIADGVSRLPDKLRTESPNIRRRTDLADLLDTTPACHVGNVSRRRHRHRRITNARRAGTASPTPQLGDEAILVGGPLQSSLNVQEDQELSKFAASE